MTLSLFTSEPPCTKKFKEMFSILYTLGALGLNARPTNQPTTRDERPAPFALPLSMTRAPFGPFLAQCVKAPGSLGSFQWTFPDIIAVLLKEMLMWQPLQ